jgi:hypothetical protein
VIFTCIFTHDVIPRQRLRHHETLVLHWSTTSFLISRLYTRNDACIAPPYLVSKGYIQRTIAHHARKVIEKESYDPVNLNTNQPQVRRHISAMYDKSDSMMWQEILHLR